MKAGKFLKELFKKSWSDYKNNGKFLTLLSFFCIFFCFLPVLLEDVIKSTILSLLILIPGTVLAYLCVYCAFLAAKGKKLNLFSLKPDFKTVFKSVLTALAGLWVFSTPFMAYFIIPAQAELSVLVQIIYILLSIIIILFSGWVTFFCFYSVLDSKPVFKVFKYSLRYLKKNLFKLFGLLFIVLLVFMAADMTIAGLFVVFPLLLVLFANLYFKFCESEKMLI